MPRFLPRPARTPLTRRAAGSLAVALTVATAPALVATGSTNLSATSGKVALVTSTSALTCGANCDKAAGVKDFVGYGSAADYETSPAPAGSNTASVQRTTAADSDNNANDFTTGAPNPQNTSAGGGGGGTRIHDIQGAAHLSPKNSTTVTGGTGGTKNLTTTELTGPVITVVSHNNALPAAQLIGSGGRVPPASVIDNDATGDVETSGFFNATTDGIDFWESLEGMRISLSSPKVVGPRTTYGEIPVVPAGSGTMTTRGGIVVRPSDFNPERITLDVVMAAPP